MPETILSLYKTSPENSEAGYKTYIKERKARDPEFADGYEAGYNASY